MMKTYTFAIFLLAHVVSISQSIDSENSLATFEVSNMKSNTVEGSLKGMSGTVDFRPDELSSSAFDVCLDAKTIFTDSKKRDEHLNKSDYLNTDGFTQMCFTSSSIVESDEGYLAKGTLTLRGISKEAVISFQHSENTLTGDLTIDRFDYDIGGKGAFMIGREVSIHIICVLAD